MKLGCMMDYGARRLQTTHKICTLNCCIQISAKVFVYMFDYRTTWLAFQLLLTFVDPFGVAGSGLCIKCKQSVFPQVKGKIMEQNLMQKSCELLPLNSIQKLIQNFCMNSYPNCPNH
jgi:hypothetical protein